MDQIESLIPRQVVDEVIDEVGITPIDASIREMKKIADELEKRTGVRFLRMEMGIPGLPPNPIGLRAEIAALERRVASRYPPIHGIAALKREAARFIKNFMDVEVSPECIVPTVGAMQASFAAFIAVNRCHDQRNTTLLLHPGFPVQEQQLRLLGLPYTSIDVYDYRGAKLEEALRRILDSGRISSILYSNPNNPTWICLTEEELSILGRLCDEYDVVALEDLAYFGMDFRKDISRPGEPPYQNTVAKYTDRWIAFISASKVFSYAGQRIALLAISDMLYHRRYESLRAHYGTDRFGHALIYGTLYALSAGTAHSAQYAFAAMLRACNEGEYNFVEGVKPYAQKAVKMKEIFLHNGFEIVYDRDGDEPIADGFYFTLRYPGMDADELLRSLLSYGISAISLKIAGSRRLDGIRACVSLIPERDFDELARRVQMFHLSRQGCPT